MKDFYSPLAYPFYGFGLYNSWKHFKDLTDRRTPYNPPGRNTSTEIMPYVPRSTARDAKFPNSGSRTETIRRRKQKKNQMFNSGYNLVKRKARNSAKRRMRHKKVRKSMAPLALMSRVSMNWFQRNEMELNRGRTLLPNLYNRLEVGAPAGTDQLQYLPLHIYSLDRTCLPTETTKPIFWHLQYARNGYGTVAQKNMYTVANAVYLKNNFDGETGAADNEYNVSTTAVASQWKDFNEDPTSKRKLYQKGVKVELMMYGQNNQDTLYRVDVVRFDQRYADAISKTQNPSVGTAFGDEWNQFWHSMIAPYTQNPTYKPRRVGRVLTIVKSYKFKIPEQSADYDRQNCVRTKFYIPLNRIINRYWKKGGSRPADTGVGDDNELDPEAAANLQDQSNDDWNQWEADGGDIHPGARYFLIIRATNTDVRLTDVGLSSLNVTPGQDPTYDISLRSEYLVDM